MTDVVSERAREHRVVDTDELLAMLARGERVLLPDVVRPADAVLDHYAASEVARLDVAAEDNDIVSVEYVGEEEVQCISVEHPRHLYITDDFIPTHNTSNIVFLKSTDDSMLDTLQKMSGVRHVSRTDSKTVTKDMGKVIKGLNTEGKVSYTMNTTEEPVISYNDMAFISERNSILFRAGDAPVWNRNSTILPMSFRLFKDTIVDPGHDYSLQTIPTLSSALDFDVRMNQPDFEKMLNKRMRQAEQAVESQTLYSDLYGYSDVDILRLDPDVHAEEVMELVDAAMREGVAEEEGGDPDYVDPDHMDGIQGGGVEGMDWEYDMAVKQQVAEGAERKQVREAEIYAGKRISKAMLVNADGSAKDQALDTELVETYKFLYARLGQDTDHFTLRSDGTLCSADGGTVYLSKVDESEAMRQLSESAEDGDSRVYVEEDVSQLGSYRVHGAFYQFLASLDSWHGLVDGEFERSMALIMQSDEG